MATVDRKPGSKQAKKAVTSEILDRQPPRSLEAEKAVLGSILLLPHVCDDVTLIIRPDDFYDDANRSIFEHFLALQNLSRQIDMALLVERLAHGRRLRPNWRSRVPGGNCPQRPHGGERGALCPNCAR